MIKVSDMLTSYARGLVYKDLLIKIKRARPCLTATQIVGIKNVLDADKRRKRIENVANGYFNFRRRARKGKTEIIKYSQISGNSAIIIELHIPFGSVISPGIYSSFIEKVRLKKAKEAE